jgi:hypothetical protein
MLFSISLIFGKPSVRCYIEPLPRGGASLAFNLSYRNGKYEIGYVELDAPDGPF